MHNKRRQRSRGQTLVIAIMVMFILAVIAAVFIALVARNLARSERFSNVDVVAQIAEAGIRYADKMLTTSEDGADWRPVPDNAGVQTNPDGTIVFDTNNRPTPAANWQEQRDRYPDFRWVRAYWPVELPVGTPEGMGYAGPSGGYTTFNTGEGRFLLRVSYNPDPEDPFSKHIKIESIGRWGVFDENDPTTWKHAGDVNLRREITAYKPIGLTEYLRFVTNRGNRSMDFALGCPGADIKMGRAEPGDPARRNWFRGGPIRVNGNLVWYGGRSVNLYMRGVSPNDAGGQPTSDVVPIDAVEVSGDIKVVDPNMSVKLTRMKPDGTPIDTNPIALLPSDDPNFTTVGGFYRDGSDLTDASKSPRGVKRIEPPDLDRLDATNSVNRYQLLTLYSAERERAVVNGRTRWFNPAQYGWGRGVYIGNNRDKQDESETLIGGYTLRADWLKPNSGLSQYWVAQYYVPPACQIILHPNDTDGDGQKDFTIIRTDTVSRGQNYVWHDAWGEQRNDWGSAVTMPYPDPNNGRTIYKRRLDGSYDISQKKFVEGNGVIYAEGNIRIRGMLPPGMQLTIVSNENIYIDGNVLKYRDPNRPIDTQSSLDPWRGADNACGLALLARENICVNTTQFFSPLNSLTADSRGSDAQNGQPPYHVVVGNSPDSQLKCLFDFGPWESEQMTASPPNHWELYLRYTGQHGPSYINAWLNPGGVGVTDWGILYLNTPWTLPDGTSHNPVTRLLKHVWGVGDPGFNAGGAGVGSLAACDVFPLLRPSSTDMGTNAHLFTAAGIGNLLQLGIDQTTYTRESCGVSRVAIQPMDIRIEAILYAQEGSFFVIPGDWFNPNPSDVPGNPRIGVRPMFPYFGQPLDVRVIIDGAIIENIPAAIGDVAQWMEKWGSIPRFYGSSQVPTAHPGEGLTILYDDHVGWPYSDLRSGSRPKKPIRTDKFGRQLPIAPKLPVSGSLLYFGDVM
jgi:type II secretory pathway pseudopilin PulG